MQDKSESPIEDRTGGTEVDPDNLWALATYAPMLLMLVEAAPDHRGLTKLAEVFNQGFAQAVQKRSHELRERAEMD